jgi:hypothetical protein
LTTGGKKSFIAAFAIINNLFKQPMKKSFLTTLLFASALSLQAEEIDSNVIHDYTSVGLGYGYLHDVAPGVNAHGVVAGVSCETHNFVLEIEGDYFVGDDDLGIGLETDAWSVSGTVGYVIRLAENHVNVIPHVGVSYNEASASVGPFSADADATVISPGVTISYAFNNCVSIAAGYSYSYDVDSETDDHSFHVGPTVRVCENVGVSVTGFFDTDDGFAGVLAGITYHF